MRLSLFLAILFFSSSLHAQNVGIGIDTPDASAKLEISSGNQGFLPPRMTFAQRNAIKHPANGLMIWCSDCYELQVYNGFMWTNMSGTSATTKSLPNVRICYHNWTYQNLSVRTYRNGDPIPVITDPAEWANLTTGAMCWYNNDSASSSGTYGALYNWYALADPRGLAPAGFHIPTNIEWNILGKCLVNDSVAAGKMKSLSLLWTTPNTGATNSSGFYALPAGMRNSDGSFSGAGNEARWWTLTPVNATNAWSRVLFYNSGAMSTENNVKNMGFSIRYVKD